MPIFEKLIIFGALNFIVLIYLLIKLIVQGNSFSKSTGLTWELIIGDTSEHPDYNFSEIMIWVPVLRKTWWFMLASFGIYWLIAPELSSLVGIISLIVFHILWYYCASLTLNWRYNRAINVNSNWGIIYRRIDGNSSIVQKSLAELDLRKKNLLVLAIERDNKIIPFPKGLEIIQNGDRLVMFGDLSAYSTAFS